MTTRVFKTLLRENVTPLTTSVTTILIFIFKMLHPYGNMSTLKAIQLYLKKACDKSNITLVVMTTRVRSSTYTCITRTCFPDEFTT